MVGGGPTCVEFAAELHDFIQQDLDTWYPTLSPYVRITLLDAGETLLGSFDRKMQEYTLRVFQRDKIDIRLQTPVREITATEVVLEDGSSISHGLVVWSTGIGARKLVSDLDFEKSAQGRLVTDRTFNVAGSETIYAIGDAATIRDEPLPATAQVAQQQGRFLALNLRRHFKGKAMKSFHYRHMGMLAYIGGRKALADTASFTGRGFSTWIFWRSAYVTKLVSLKNKIMVLFDWFKAAIFGRDISRF